MRNARIAALAAVLALAAALPAAAQEKTQKPPLHGTHWMAITGKPLAATAGARMFEKGGNAVDAACAMLAATSTMWDVLSWGGETQALIFNPRTPLPTAMRLIPRLSVRDLKDLGRDRNVPDAVRSTALRLYRIKQQ